VDDLVMFHGRLSEGSTQRATMQDTTWALVRSSTGACSHLEAPTPTHARRFGGRGGARCGTRNEVILVRDADDCEPRSFPIRLSDGRRLHTVGWESRPRHGWR
jgi:hypothetical protein